ncbi:universal stress protein [Azohydromonas caseinilytica]|uniref:Universal stress protein n=1 Tax=Azohydromonas caseinilytica TaxID=2728836 RepID=A0A848FAC3_9BURK|nr:universal stress protein [Azohydromonas caseinilytica]NML17117.1 universal stress protein [Azohydromonas caseinilytica]
MKILVAVDGSACSKRMLAHLVSEAMWRGDSHQYTVFHGIEPLPHRAAALAPPPTVRALYDSQAEAVLRPVRTFLHRHGIDARFVHKVCRPAREIARMAAVQHFDLVIMGSHGHGRLGNAVLGSVVTQVLAQAKTPLLVFR